MSKSAPTEAILSAQSVTRSFGAQPVLDDISLTIHEGERVGLIGRNGCGKSTFMKILAGLDEPDSGLVTRRQGLRVGMLAQECELDLSLTIDEAMQLACAEMQTLLHRHTQLSETLTDESLQEKERTRLQEEFDNVHHTLEVHDGWNLQQSIDKISNALGVPEADRKLSTLSGGELRRVDLAATLVRRPDVLLLDEPTNHIDTRSVEWIERFLAGYEGTCLLITHDRYFLDLVVNRIVEIEFNQLYSFPGNYERFLEYKSQLQEVAVRTEASRQNILRSELEWLRRGPKARSTKQKARIKRYEDLDAQGGPNVHKSFGFQIPTPPRLGKRVLDVTDLQFSYGTVELFRDFNMILQKGMRVGIAGPNGSGKTTLLRCLLGQEDGYKGKILAGESTEFLYIDQQHSDIDPEKSILDFVSSGSNHMDVNGNRVFIPGYLEAFLFDTDTLHAPIRNLSGGERNRIELAKKLLRGGNVLVLDEPTNDLDLPTLRVLEEAILNFDGAVIIVSHDRYFLNRLCTDMIVFRGEGDLYFSAGNYDDYLRYEEETSSDRKPRITKPTPTPTSEPISPAPAKKKLSYLEKKELEGIEESIAIAESEVERLQLLVNAEGFYEQEYAEVQKTLDALKSAELTVESMYARWEELDLLSAGQ